MNAHDPLRPVPRQPGVVDPALVMSTAKPQRAPLGAMPGAVTTPMPASLGPVPHTARTPPPADTSAGDEAKAARATKVAGSSRWGRAIWLLVALMGALLVYDTVISLIDVWSRDPIGGGLLTALALAFLGALGVSVEAELRTVRRLRDVARFRKEMETALEQDSARRLSKALAPLLSMVHERRPDLVRDFRHRVQGQTECAAILKQFRGAVLVPLDQEARRAVRGNAMTVLGATAISPHPALDMAIVVWRGVVMVRKVAEIYGLRPGGLATLYLTRSVVVSAALAMAADPAGEAVANALGGSLAEKVSARFAEGSISGLRALRLGVRSIEICRPLPFEPAERNGMLHTLMQG
ncbi:TIGR01620 family protein [Roseospira visakhapatnamensis]|uniref:Putative membrane protein n=1 Tax=Roseospira visakhapatnamensis TaxID=390880 RepID=A0A7W6W9Q1_9PROT|nr:TIGR01620 family protein [Roseospira visakhapatnamensis]MBB4265701.1 putative membrane protein [Roseospira visakhapatnamensis]